MVITIKKGTSVDKIKALFKLHAKKRKGIELQKYCGAISLKEDVIAVQKNMRDEWE